VIVGAAVLSLLLTGAFVQLAGRSGWGKAERADGPKSHLVKAGTPTMGGSAFMLAALALWLVWGERNADSWALALLIVAAALLGLADDVLALRRKTRAARGEDVTTGLLARYRLSAQGIAALAFAIYAAPAHGPIGVVWLDVGLIAVAVVGCINAFNFSDGLDGLAAGLAAIILTLFLGSPLAAALFGALLGFLWYNAHPARVFMGGVGSEGLGAAVAGLAVTSGMTWWLPLFAIVPVVVVLSVIVQVLYFRATGGKRLLKMAPIHHHFELSGWGEVQVVVRFWLMTVVAVALTWWWRGPM
jgi:phospho-N-acetylmuramoyl-pentapeptide-transferase